MFEIITNIEYIFVPLLIVVIFAMGFAKGYDVSQNWNEFVRGVVVDC